MLDVFLKTLVERDKRASAEDEMAERFKQLPLEEVSKIASGKVKLSYHDDEGNCWLKKYEGTPLYDQAIALEEECIQIESEDIERRIARRQEDKTDTWDLKDMLRLKKRQLDLELNKQRAAGESPPSGETGDDEEGTEALSADESPQEVTASVKAAQTEHFEGKKAPPYQGAAKKGEPPALMGGKPKSSSKARNVMRALKAVQEVKTGSAKEAQGGPPISLSEEMEGGEAGGRLLGTVSGAGLGAFAGSKRGTGIGGRLAGAGIGALGGAVGGNILGGQVGRGIAGPATIIRQGAQDVSNDPALQEQLAILQAQHEAKKTSAVNFIDLAGRSMAHAMYKEGQEGYMSQAGLAQEIDALRGEKGLTPEEARAAYITEQQRGGAIGGGLAGGVAGGMAGAGVGEALGPKGALPGALLGAGIGGVGGAFGGRALAGKGAKRTAGFHKTREQQMAEPLALKAASAMKYAAAKVAERTWGQAIGDHFAGGLSPSWATQRQLDRQTKAAKQPAAQPVAAAPQMPKAAEVEKQSFLAGALMGGAIGGKGAAEKQTQENQMQQAGIGLTSPQKVKHGLRGAAIKMNPLAPKVAAMAPGGEQWGQQDTDAAKQLAGTAGRSMVEAIPGTAAVKAIGSALYGSKKPAATPGVPPPPKVASAMKYAASRVGISPLAP